jgi:hypothetical protein
MNGKLKEFINNQERERERERIKQKRVLFKNQLNAIKLKF